MSILWSLLGFVIVMGLIVTIHEWGHYQVARWFNIKVTTFSIGFGKTIYQRQGAETCFKIGMIPLGGYVKFVDERDGQVSVDDLPRAFNRQNVYKRFAVVLAGPMVNLIFAWLVFTVMYMVGVSGFKPVFSQVNEKTPLQSALPNSFFEYEQSWSVIEVDQEPIYNWQMLHQAVLKSLVDQEVVVDLTIENIFTNERLYLPEISLENLDLNQPDQGWLQVLGFKPFKIPMPALLGQIVEGGPAELAGLKKGDLILAIDNRPIDQWADLVDVVKSLPGQTVSVQYRRGDVDYQTDLEIASHQKGDEAVGKMGVGVEVQKELMQPYYSTVQYGFIDASVQAYIKSVDLLNMSLTMIKRMIFGEVGLENLSGPISIAQFSGQAVQSGLIAFLSLLAILSLSVGILNLLPIPVLDGGHLVYYLVEMIKGSPVSEQVVEVGQKIGLVLILGLTFVALSNDVLRISNG